MRVLVQHIFILILSFYLVCCSEDPVEELDQGILTGKVVENGSNAPLENVKISTNPNTSTVFSDAEGNFIIDEILVGQYAVLAEIDGYVAAFESANINSDSSTNLIFELEEETAENLPPSMPVLIAPQDSSSEIELSTQFIWSGADPESDDFTSVSYTHLTLPTICSV